MLYTDSNEEQRGTQRPKKQPRNSFIKALSLITIGAVGATAISLGAGGLRSDNDSTPPSRQSVHAASNITEAPTADDATKTNAISINNEQSPTAADDNSLLIGNATPDETIENRIARDAIDSIVGITVTIEQRQQIMTPFGMSQNAPRYVEGVGSGVILTTGGLIITNSHVVNGGNNESLIVTLSDDTEVKGKVLWADETLDLALVDIDHDGLKPITIAGTDTLEVGDKVIAIGNPLGLDLQSTLTSGYVSGLDRTITVEGGNSMENLIQTDAAINSGNSGGALLNAAGELVAINTAKASMADGIGFAIPLETARPIIDRVLETGSYDQVALGITGMKADDYEAAVYQMKGQDLELPSGVYVASVAEGSAAEAAGLQRDDVITKIDGQAVDAMNALKQALIPFQVGDSTTLTIFRNGETMELTLTFTQTLTELNETPATPIPEETQTPDPSQDGDHSEGGSMSREDVERFFEEFFNEFRQNP